MSIVKIPDERTEQFSITLHPEIDYLSSSMSIPSLGVTPGTTGSAPLRLRPSKFIKTLVAADVIRAASDDLYADETSPRPFNWTDFSSLMSLQAAIDQTAAANIAGTYANVSRWVENYLDGVNQSPNPISNTKRVFITRFDPPFTLNDVAIEKSVIRNNLMTFYESRYDLCEMAYTNYHTLNFFSAPNGGTSPAVGKTERIPDNSALIYQNFSEVVGDPRPYYPSGAFSIDFYINPRYSNDKGREFTAGTILHLSSTFALSLVSGSSRDSDNLVNGYRLLLQLSHSADIPPTKIDLNSPSISVPRDLIFLTDDNTLSKNEWHHCSVRWGTNSFNEGTGSITIDSTQKSFVVPSASILPPSHIAASALVVGNYYQGYDNEALFFNESTAKEGVHPTLDFGSSFNQDPQYTMNNPLNAEIHELKIYKKYLSSRELKNIRQTSPSSYRDLLFYVPPMFLPHAHPREMLITPFQSQLTQSIHPFNETFSFGVGGFVMNLENHVKDLVTNNMPRCLNLTASTIDTTTVDISAAQYCYGTGSIKKRNLTILPNDNGKFKPDYSILTTGSAHHNALTRRRKSGVVNSSIVSLEKMIPRNKIFTGIPTVAVKALDDAIKAGDATVLFGDDTSSSSMAALLAGVTPESMGGSAGPILTIAQRTRDLSSNEICFFDISNIYYGNKILEDTLYIRDAILTGSDGKVNITLADNGAGGLYRCDAVGNHATWSNLGNILYEEGVAIVKSPILTFFGKECFEIKFRGEQNTHVSIINVQLGAGLFNSSSNPQYKLLSASSSPADIGKKFVYVDSLNIHDENLNVIARTNFAQPVKKRVDDTMVIRFKMDF